jgi:hypothetical protein
MPSTSSETVNSVSMLPTLYESSEGPAAFSNVLAVEKYKLMGMALSPY